MDRQNSITINNNTAKLLWTGGWDSTFRLLQLLLEDKKPVQPIYIISRFRKSSDHELKVMENIRELLTERGVQNLLRPTAYFYGHEIKIDNDILKAWEKINTKRHLGDQYLWLASFCKHYRLEKLELSIQARDIKDGISETLAYNLQESRITPDYKAVFKYFSLPILNLTKREMREIAQEKDWMDIMELTWFCHHPIYHPTKGRVACGICNPCRIAVSEGFGHKIPLVLRHSGKYLKKIYNSSLMSHFK